MPTISLYPNDYDVWTPHGTLMNEEPLHNDVHLLLESAISKLQAENGLNPSGTHATVAARAAAIEAAIASLSTSISSVSAAAAAAQATANSKTQLGTAIRQPSTAYAAGNVAMHVRIGSVVVTLDGFGTATITMDTAMASADYVVFLTNGDANTANAAATVALRSITNASQFIIQAQRTHGTAATGSFRCNYWAVQAMS